MGLLVNALPKSVFMVSISLVNPSIKEMSTVQMDLF